LDIFLKTVIKVIRREDITIVNQATIKDLDVDRR
jgi:hypothetical protein